MAAPVRAKDVNPECLRMLTHKNMNNLKCQQFESITKYRNYRGKHNFCLFVCLGWEVESGSFCHG